MVQSNNGERSLLATGTVGGILIFKSADYIISSWAINEWTGGERNILFFDVPHFSGSLLAAPLRVLQIFITYVVLTTYPSDSSTWYNEWTPPKELRLYLMPSALTCAQSKPEAEARPGSSADPKREEKRLDCIRMVILRLGW